MSQRADARPAPGNHLLAALPRAEYEELLPQLQIVLPRQGEVLYEPGEPIRHVYFPISGVISLVTTLKDGTMAEIATIGNEGMLGLATFLEVDSLHWKAFLQIPGNSFRLQTDEFREVVSKSPAFQRLLHRYAQALLYQVAQTAVCNRFHESNKRCARWLLMTHDRVGSDQFSLTHEFLAAMLGVRRATVSAATALLQQAGLIRHSRGSIVVVNPSGLQDACCECYEVVKQEYVRLLGDGRA